MTDCSICGGSIPDLDEGPSVCQHCGAVAIMVGAAAEEELEVEEEDV
jgi:hypothetical protein